MTIQEIIDLFGANHKVILNYYIVLLVVSLLGLLFVKQESFKSPINYVYSILIYAVTIPGLLSFILVLYGFFFLHLNLLQVNVLAYFLPIIAMVVLLILISKTISLRLIPGFEKLSGLFMIIMVTFIVTYILQRMFFGVIFFGGFSQLAMLFVGLLVLIRIGWYKLMR